MGAGGTKKANLHLNGNSGLPIRALRGGVGRGLRDLPSWCLVYSIVPAPLEAFKRQVSTCDHLRQPWLFPAPSGLCVSCVCFTEFCLCSVLHIWFLEHPLPVSFSNSLYLVFLCCTGGFLLMLVIHCHFFRAFPSYPISRCLSCSTITFCSTCP